VQGRVPAVACSEGSSLTTSERSSGAGPVLALHLSLSVGQVRRIIYVVVCDCRESRANVDESRRGRCGSREMMVIRLKPAG
jgi:hypothetical protein